MARITDIGLAGLVAGILGLADPAGAAPLAPGAITLAGTPGAVTIAYGCGRGYAPGRYGGCRPIYRGTGYVGPRRGYRYDGPRYGVDLPGVRFHRNGVTVY